MPLELNVADPAPANPNVADPKPGDLNLDDILGAPKPANPSAVSEPAKPPVSSQPAVVDEAKKRYEYWQSQADHFKGELEKVQPLALEYQKLAPVIEFLKQHPDEIEKIGKTSQPAPTTVQTLKPPTKPTPPEGYNLKEAYDFSNPDNPSFKYRVAQDEYSKQLTEFMFAKQELLEQEAQNRSKLEQARNLEKQKIAELGQKLIAEYGFTQEQTADFVQVMNSPASTEIGNLVNLYKVIKHKTKNAAIARNSSQPANNIPPPPVNGNGGDRFAQPTEEEQFMSGIANFGKPFNPLLDREGAGFSKR